MQVHLTGITLEIKVEVKATTKGQTEENKTNTTAHISVVYHSTQKVKITIQHILAKGEVMT